MRRAFGTVIALQVLGGLYLAAKLTQFEDALKNKLHGSK